MKTDKQKVKIVFWCMLWNQTFFTLLAFNQGVGVRR